MIDRMVIERKLRRIEEHLRELGTVPVPTLEEYRANLVVRRFIERQLELCVEQMIDACRHLVAGLDLSQPETYAGCLDILATAGVVGAAHLPHVKSLARFRGVLVHGYDDVDDAIAHGILTTRLGDFADFTKDVRAYLSK